MAAFSIVGRLDVRSVGRGVLHSRCVGLVTFAPDAYSAASMCATFAQ